MIPGNMQPIIEAFYNELCAILTEYEEGEISALDLYGFMSDTANKITDIAYDEEG